MTEYIYTKEEALSIVASDKFYNVLFDEVADRFSSKTLINIGNKLNIKIGDLHNLDPKQLVGLFNTFDREKPVGEAEKNAFYNICDAINKKVRLFSEGKIDISVDKSEDMLEMIEKVKNNSKSLNKKVYDFYEQAEKRIKINEIKYDAFHHMDNIAENDIETINNNIEQMLSWHPDVTKLIETKNISKAAVSRSKFAFIKQIIDKTVVQGEYTLLGRKNIPQKDEDGNLKKDSEIALWLEDVRDLTIREMCLSKNNITQDQFDKSLATNIETEFLKLANVNEIIKGKNKQKNYKSLIKSIAKNKTIKIDQSSFCGYSSAASVEREAFIDRLIKKIDAIEEKIVDVTKKTIIGNQKAQIANNLKDAAKKIDEKAEKKFGAAYVWGKDMVKNISNSSLWGAAFGVAAHLSGPIGISVVSAVSLYKYGYPFIKEYRAQKQERKAKGKDLTFTKYLKKNKTTTLALAFNALSVAIPIVDVAGNTFLQTVANNRILDFARNNSAIGIALVQAANEYREAKKNKESTIKASLKGAGCFVSGVVGFMVGNVAAQNTLMAIGDCSVSASGRDAAGDYSVSVSGRDAAGKMGTLVKKINAPQSAISTTSSTNLNLLNKRFDAER